MIEQIVFLCVGAVLGAIVGRWYGTIADRAAQWLASVRRARLGRQFEVSREWSRAIAAYRQWNLEASLYQLELIGTPSAPVPALHSRRTSFPEVVDIRTDPLMQCDHELQILPSSARIVRRYRRRGVRLFDGKLLALRSANITDGRLIELRVGQVNYFPYATLSYRLQRDISSRRRRGQMHHRHLRSFDAALANGLQPQALGCAVATLLTGSDGLYVAVARRSEQVLNGPGTISVLPLFGMECHALGQRESTYGLTFYNFVREFCEEFFDLEELVQVMEARRAEPDWIFQLPPARAVVREASQHRLLLSRTAFLVGLNDGSLNCTLIAHFTSHKFFEWLIAECRINWESATSNTAPPVEFVKLDDVRLDKWLDEHVMEPTSAVALDRARMYAAKLARDNSPTIQRGTPVRSD